ncbi:MAG: glycosyltransferase family 2 protein [Anaerolineaceae bacterium]|nr:glycosyltransferase family 2 protein [Anaerolineaceae bacterium]
MEKDIKKNASVIIPVYNGEGTIIQLTERLLKVLPELFENYEIILVDDCSPDDSWKVLKDLQAKKPEFVRAIHLSRNYGQHNATLCGIRAARYEICVTMDDDLQHPPEQLHLLIEELDKGFDVVYAIPKKLPHSWWRNLGSKMTKIILGKIMGIPIREIGAFRVFRTNLREAFANYRSPEVYIDPILAWGTKNFGHVYVEEDKREIGESNYSFAKLVKASLLILTGYSTVPLRFASMLGFLFMLFGVAILIYVIIVAISLGSTPGFPFLASIISIFAGVQLFTLGIIGEYLARVYDRASDRPTYIIREKADLFQEDNTK